MTTSEFKAKLIAEIESFLRCYIYEEISEEALQALDKLKDFINSLPEEPVKIKKGCKYRCLSDMVNKDTRNIAFVGDKIYLAPKDNTLVSEENGWLCDTSENASNFELVEEPVSNSDWLTELQEKLDNATPEQLQELWDKYPINDEEEPVGEDLEKASREWLRPQLDQSYANYGETKMMELTHFDGYAMLDAIEFGAQWQKNHIWHDADKELPQKDSRVLCLTQNGRHYDSCWYGSRYCEGFAYITFSEFTNVMELHNVDKWCYLNDIFPKED